MLKRMPHPWWEGYVLKHYDHEASLAAGRRVFQDVMGWGIVALDIAEVSRRVGVPPEELDLFLRRSGFHLSNQ